MSKFSTPDGKPALRAASRAVWRAWLEEHHATADVVWCVFARKHAAEPTVGYAEAVEEALCFGWIDGVLHKLDADHCAHRFTPRRSRSLWSRANVERVERLIESGSMRPAGLRLVEAARASGAFAKAYRVGDDVEMPPELAEALGRSPRGKQAFAALPPGQRRDWARGVLWVKGTRAKKAEEVVALLLAGRKPGETDAQAARRGLPTKREILDAANGAKEEGGGRRRGLPTKREILDAANGAKEEGGGSKRR